MWISERPWISPRIAVLCRLIPSSRSRVKRCIYPPTYPPPRFLGVTYQHNPPPLLPLHNNKMTKNNNMLKKSCSREKRGVRRRARRRRRRRGSLVLLLLLFKGSSRSCAGCVQSPMQTVCLRSIAYKIYAGLWVSGCTEDLGCGSSVHAFIHRPAVIVHNCTAETIKQWNSNVSICRRG